MYEKDLRRIALALVTGDEFDDMEFVGCGDRDFNIKVGNAEYLVLDEDEMEEEFDEKCKNYVDECIIGCVPEGLRQYFEVENVYDALLDNARDAGYGDTIGTYDGIHSDVHFTLDGVKYDYNIFRI